MNTIMDFKLNPWEQLPGESLKQFDAFQTYLKLGKERSYRRTAEILKLSVQTIKKYGSRNNWLQRVTICDNVMLLHNKFEHLHALEIADNDKFNLSFDMSELMLKAAKDLFPYAQYYNGAYNIAEVTKKVKFLQLISHTIFKLLKFADFNPHRNDDRQLFLRYLSKQKLLQKYEEEKYTNDDTTPIMQSDQLDNIQLLETGDEK